MSKEITEKKTSLVERIGERFGVDGVKVFETLKATAFKQRNGAAPTNEQMLVLLTVAEQYGLNPFTKELFAFPDGAGGIIPLVSVDGWARIINNHSAMDGIEFVSSEKMVRMEGAKVDCPEWIECIIYRSDRKHPIKIREYLDEVYRPPFTPKGKPYSIEGPWQSHPKRFLRHKTLIQASRIAFGFSGIYDNDEAERILEAKQAEARNMGNVVRDIRPQQSKAQAVLPSSVSQKTIDTLISRAKSNGAWDTSHKYLIDRYSGEELDHALEQLETARVEHEMGLMPIPENTASSHDLLEETHNGHEERFDNNVSDAEYLYEDDQGAFM